MSGRSGAGCGESRTATPGRVRERRRLWRSPPQWKGDRRGLPHGCGELERDVGWVVDQPVNQPVNQPDRALACRRMSLAEAGRTLPRVPCIRCCECLETLGEQRWTERSHSRALLRNLARSSASLLARSTETRLSLVQERKSSV